MKKVTSTNITTSIKDVGYDTILNGGVSMLTGSMTEVVIPSIEQTSQIIYREFFDDYAKNIHNQTAL